MKYTVELIDTMLETRSVDYEPSIDVEADSIEEARTKAEAIAVLLANTETCDARYSDVKWHEGDSDIMSSEPQLCHEDEDNQMTTNRFVAVWLHDGKGMMHRCGDVD
jgi:hypothetical protein